VTCRMQTHSNARTELTPVPSAAESDTVQTDPNQAFRPLHRTFGIYLLFAFGWGCAIHYYGRQFTLHPPWIVFMGMVVFSVPIVLSSLYLNTTRKIRNLTAYNRTGRWYRFFCGRTLATLFWSIWAVVSTFVVLLQFHTYSTAEWVGFFLVVPLFWLTYKIVQTSLAAEMKPYLVTSTAIRVTRCITPLVAAAVYLAVLFLFVEVPQHDSLEGAIDYAKSQAGQQTGSALVFELAQYQAYYDGAKYFVLGQFRGEGAAWAILLMGVGSYVIFFSTCAMLSCFAVPLHEYRRVFAPLADTDDPPPVTGWSVGLTAAIFSFVVLFVFLPGFTFVEQVIRQDNQRFIEARKKADLVVIQIDGDFFRLGAQDALHDAKVQTLRKMDSLLPELNRELDQAFMNMAANVEPFLDWYYSLSAEYWRTIHLLAGNIEGYLAEQLNEHLQHGEPFKNFDMKVAEGLALQKAIQEEFLREAQAILASNQVAPPEDVNLIVVQRIALQEMLTLPQHKDMVEIEKRLGMSSGAGIIAAFATKKIMAKIAAKGTLKMAGAAVVKMIGGKAVASMGGATGGAAAGAAIGTLVFPGVGTTVGASIGGIVGAVSAGVAMDKGLLMLEEHFGRDQFSEDLLSAIRETRAAFQADLYH
jgi:hypothetical protein